MTDPFARPPGQPAPDSELTVPVGQPDHTPPSRWPVPEETAIDPLSQGQGWQWGVPAPPVTPAPGYPSPTPQGYTAYEASPSTPQHAGYPPYPANAAAPWTQNVPYGYAEAALPEHPNATTALVLGILSVVGVFPLGPIAWYLGAKGQREVRENPGRWRQGGSLTAGLVLGVISTIPLILLALFLLFLFFGLVAL